MVKKDDGSCGDDEDDDTGVFVEISPGGGEKDDEDYDGSAPSNKCTGATFDEARDQVENYDGEKYTNGASSSYGAPRIKWCASAQTHAQMIAPSAQ